MIRITKVLLTVIQKLLYKARIQLAQGNDEPLVESPKPFPCSPIYSKEGAPMTVNRSHIARCICACFALACLSGLAEAQTRMGLVGPGVGWALRSQGTVYSPNVHLFCKRPRERR